MSLRRWGFTLAATAAVSCGVSESAVTEADAGAPEAASTNASDADAAPDGCNADWCVVPLDDAQNVSLNAIAGSAPDDVWIVGTGGYAAHFDGARWETRRVNTLASLFSVWGSGPDDVWASNSGGVFFHYTAGAWQAAPISAKEKRPVIALAGSGPEDVYALVERAPEMTEYELTCQVKSPSGNYSINVSCPDLYRFSRIGEQLAWRRAVTGETACASFRPPLGNCDRFYGMWIPPEGTPWLSGDFGQVLQSKAAPGGKISTTPDETRSLRSLFGIWGTSIHDVWAVGAGGVIRHYGEGPSWDIVDSPVHANLRAVRGDSGEDVWAVGDGATIVHWDGATWTVSATPLPPEKARDLYAVWTDGGGGVWVAGDRVLLRRAPKKGGPG